MKINKLLVVLVIIVMTVFLAACGGNNASTTGENDNATGETQIADELTVAVGSDFSTFDPQFCTDSGTESINKNIYNNLVKFDKDMNLVPDLAESWELSPDGLTWTFKLRQGVTFHDGTPFNAEAVKATYERILDENVGSPNRSVLEAISKIDVVDDNTVNITTATPCGSLLHQLAHPTAAIISPTALETYGDQYASHPTGTGPYKFVEWKTGEEVTLERNENYFDGAPQVQKVVFQGSAG